MSDGVTIFRGPRALLAMAAGVSVGLALATAHSAPLPREDCDKLATERTALMAAGIVDQMAKGPAWAKSNLPAAKMTEVERFITIDELLSFRCGMSRMKLDIPDEEQAAADAEAKKPGSPVKGAPVPKKVSPPKAAAAVPAAKKPVASTASAPKAPARVLKPPAGARKTPVPPAEPATAADVAKKATAAPKPKPRPKPKPAEPTTDPS